MREDRQRLRVKVTGQQQSIMTDELHPGTRRFGGEGKTHTWFSPFGERNQAATHMAAMMNRPMKMLHLSTMSAGTLSKACSYACMIAFLPVSHFGGWAVCSWGYWEQA